MALPSFHRCTAEQRWPLMHCIPKLLEETCACIDSAIGQDPLAKDIDRAGTVQATLLALFIESGAPRFATTASDQQSVSAFAWLPRSVMKGVFSRLEWKARRRFGAACRSLAVMNAAFSEEEREPAVRELKQLLQNGWNVCPGKDPEDTSFPWHHHHGGVMASPPPWEPIRTPQASAMIAVEFLKHCSEEQRAPFVGRIAELLANWSPAVRAKASSFLIQCEQSELGRFIPEFTELLHHKEVDVRAEAVKIFANVSVTERASVLPKIASLVQDSAPVDYEVVHFFKKGSANERALVLPIFAERLSCSPTRTADRFLPEFFLACTPLERAPYLCVLATALEAGIEPLEEGQPKKGHIYPPNTPVNMSTYRRCYLSSAVLHLAQHRSPSIRESVLNFFAKCLAEERAPFLRRISKRLQDYLVVQLAALQVFRA